MSCLLGRGWRRGTRNKGGNSNPHVPRSLWSNEVLKSQGLRTQGGFQTVQEQITPGIILRNQVPRSHSDQELAPLSYQIKVLSFIQRLHSIRQHLDTKRWKGGLRLYKSLHVSRTLLQSIQPSVQTTESFWKFLLVFSNSPENHSWWTHCLSLLENFKSIVNMYLLNLLILAFTDWSLSKFSQVYLPSKGNFLIHDDGCVVF